jgi:uncharacterized protein YhfF
VARSQAADRALTRYWAQLLRSASSESAWPRAYYEAFRFGFGAAPEEASESATSIAALVLAGTKTSTAALQWVYDAEGRRPPGPGDLSIVLDGDERPVCVIETTEATVVGCDELVDARFAYAGGEGDRTLESWRRTYWRYILAECARLEREPSRMTPLVCERFRVVCGAPLEIEVTA